MVGVYLEQEKEEVGRDAEKPPSEAYPALDESYEVDESILPGDGAVQVEEGDSVRAQSFILLKIASGIFLMTSMMYFHTG